MLGPFADLTTLEPAATLNVRDVGVLFLPPDENVTALTELPSPTVNVNDFEGFFADNDPLNVAVAVVCDGVGVGVGAGVGVAVGRGEGVGDGVGDGVGAGVGA